MTFESDQSSMYANKLLFHSKDVTGQVVLITGGGGGVGANLAKNFAKLNARVVIWDINKDGTYILCRFRIGFEVPNHKTAEDSATIFLFNLSFIIIHMRGTPINR